MDIREKIGQRLVFGFPGTTIPAEFAALVREYKIGNVILFRYNIESLPQLARLCSTSESNFRKLFHAGVGCSPKAYLQTMRMKFAAVKLAHTATPIIEIAAKCGFGSFSNFNRQFLRHHGVSPSQYRRKNT